MKYGCIGQTLKHSFSKDIHAKLFDYEYSLQEIAPEELDAFMRQKDFNAINVTIPYKQAVIPYLDEVEESALTIGAVNTIVNRNGKLYGYNTDFAGMTALIKKTGLELQNKKVLICGSGGTSKTALAVAKALGAREVYRLSRHASDDCILYQDAYQDHVDAQIIIQTTPLGMYPKRGAVSIDIDRFRGLEGVIDAVYNPLRPAIVEKALEKGLIASGGLYMLVAQAAYAAEHFIGRPAADKIDAVYQSLLKEKENIVLIGMPGSGKSTVGKRLAEALSMDFADSDAEIVKQAGKTIPEIFASEGEDGFRNLESKVIAELAMLQHTVIATGGGAVLRSQNVSALKENGRVYFLDRKLEDILPTADRPLSSDRQSLEKRYRERYNIYTSAADRKIACPNGVGATVEMIKSDFLKA